MRISRQCRGIGDRDRKGQLLAIPQDRNLHNAPDRAAGNFARDARRFRHVLIADLQYDIAAPSRPEPRGCRRRRA